MRYCLEPGCPELVEGDRVPRCPGHTVKANNWGQKRTAEPSSGWQRASLHKKVLRRDKHRCQIPGCHRAGTEVDHVIPRHKGGSDDMRNLRAICPEHHRIKSEQERIAALRNRSGD